MLHKADSLNRLEHADFTAQNTAQKSSIDNLRADMRTNQTVDDWQTAQIAGREKKETEKERLLREYNALKAKYSIRTAPLSMPNRTRWPFHFSKKCIRASHEENSLWLALFLGPSKFLRSKNFGGTTLVQFCQPCQSRQANWNKNFGEWWLDKFTLYQIYKYLVQITNFNQRSMKKILRALISFWPRQIFYRTKILTGYLIAKSKTPVRGFFVC